MRMAIPAYQRMMETIASRRPESGGLLLGPIGSSEITDFFFDAGGTCTNATYTPDHVTLQRLMREVWIPNGLDMKGFAHSHPAGFDRLSAGDIDYVGRLLRKNADMEVFSAPIILPQAFRIVPYVVLRAAPRTPVRARLTLF